MSATNFNRAQAFSFWACPRVGHIMQCNVLVPPIRFVRPGWSDSQFRCQALSTTVAFCCRLSWMCGPTCTSCSSSSSFRVKAPCASSRTHPPSSTSHGTRCTSTRTSSSSDRNNKTAPGSRWLRDATSVRSSTNFPKNCLPPFISSTWGVATCSTFPTMWRRMSVTRWDAGTRVQLERWCESPRWAKHVSRFQTCLVQQLVQLLIWLRHRTSTVCPAEFAVETQRYARISDTGNKENVHSDGTPGLAESSWSHRASDACGETAALHVQEHEGTERRQVQILRSVFKFELPQHLDLSTIFCRNQQQFCTPSTKLCTHLVTK